MKVLTSKDCYYYPMGSSQKIPVTAGKHVVVSDVNGKRMIDGNVAIEVDKPKKKVALKKPAKK